MFLRDEIHDTDGASHQLCHYTNKQNNKHKYKQNNMYLYNHNKQIIYKDCTQHIKKNVYKNTSHEILYKIYSRLSANYWKWIK